MDALTSTSDGGNWLVVSDLSGEAPFTGIGGNWLTVTGCGAYCPTPRAITASINTGGALAAGSPSGTAANSARRK